MEKEKEKKNDEVALVAPNQNVMIEVRILGINIHRREPIEDMVLEKSLI